MARSTAEDRLARLLVMLPWLMERGSVPLSEVAARFDLKESEVVEDLELASMCGLPPYVDELIDLFIDEGMVVVGVPRLFTRPLRLNSMEGFELLVAARSAMELPGADPSGPLGRGLSKLAAALGADGPEGIGVDVELLGAHHGVMGQVVEATEQSKVMEVHYFNPNREEVSTKRLCPLQVFADRGNWYVVAYEADVVDPGRRTSQTLRTYRVDRILEMMVTDESFDRPHLTLPEPGKWFVDEGIPQVTLSLRPAAIWITERYPMVEVGDMDPQGCTTVTLAVVSNAWLERLLMRLGPDAEVLAPFEVRDQLQAAANKILGVYQN
jgi:predicted DNA-binding transcriptional regulator YafY